MRKLITLTAASAVIAASSVSAHAQFGWSVTFDPTQATHAISQIAQAEKTYTQTVQTTENVINAYNLAKRMASSPTSLYTSYGSGLPSWVPMLPSNDTYGNTGTWINSVNKYTGQAASAIQGASVARIAQMTGYENVDAKGQRAIAAQTARRRQSGSWDGERERDDLQLCIILSQIWCTPLEKSNVSWRF